VDHRLLRSQQLKPRHQSGDAGNRETADGGPICERNDWIRTIRHVSTFGSASDWIALTTIWLLVKSAESADSALIAGVAVAAVVPMTAGVPVLTEVVVDAAVAGSE